MGDLRYVCRVRRWPSEQCLSADMPKCCGPLNAETAISDDGTQRDAPTQTGESEEAPAEVETPPVEEPDVAISPGSSSSSDSAASPATSVAMDEVKPGYELCNACVQHEGAAHAKLEATDPARHAFREIVKDDRGLWREVIFEDHIDCSYCGQLVSAAERFKCACREYQCEADCPNRPDVRSLRFVQRLFRQAGRAFAVFLFLHRV
jgi:hypothetical protein